MQPNSPNPFANPAAGSMEQQVAAAQESQRFIEQQRLAAIQGGAPPPPNAKTSTRPSLTPEQQAEVDAAENEKRLVAHRAQMAEWEKNRPAVLSAARKYESVAERLVLAADYWLPALFDVPAFYGGYVSRPDKLTTDLVLWAEAFPEIWRSPEDVDLDPEVAPWPTGQVAKWWAKEAKRRDLKAGAEVSKCFWFDSTTWSSRRVGHGDFEATPAQIGFTRRGGVKDGPHVSMSGLQGINYRLELRDPKLAIPLHRLAGFQRDAIDPAATATARFVRNHRTRRL